MSVAKSAKPRNTRAIAAKSDPVQGADPAVDPTADPVVTDPAGDAPSAADDWSTDTPGEEPGADTISPSRSGDETTLATQTPPVKTDQEALTSPEPSDDRSAASSEGQTESQPDDVGVAGATDDPTETPAHPEPARDRYAETAMPPVPVVTDVPRAGGGPGFLTLLAGGLIAGAIGFAAAWYGLLASRGDESLARIDARLTEQSALVDELAAEVTGAASRATAATETAAAAQDAVANAATRGDLADLRDEFATLSAARGESPVTPSDGGSTAARLEELESQTADLAVQVTDLATRLDDLTAAVAPDQTAATLTAYEQQLAALQAELDAQRAAIADATSAAAEARSSATDETRRITVLAALAQIGAAVDSGDPFVDSLSALETAGDIEVPGPLSSRAASGVDTLSALQRDFAPAARKALAVSLRESSGGSAWNRFGAFVRTQTGARSLGEKPGPDPDAILSRAEAAVRRGALGDALVEIGALPEAGQAEMAGWVARAETRLAATAALDDLSATLNSN